MPNSGETNYFLFMARVGSSMVGKPIRLSSQFAAFGGKSLMTDKAISVTLSEGEQAHVGRVYSWVEHNQEFVWTEALLTIAHMDRFLVMPNHSCVSRHSPLKELKASTTKKRSVVALQEKEGKRYCREKKGSFRPREAPPSSRANFEPAHLPIVRTRSAQVPVRGSLLSEKVPYTQTI